MAFIQISAFQRAEQKRSCNTWWAVRRVLVWKRRAAQKGELRGKSAAYDTESNPAISCTLGESCSALSIYGNGICMKGKPGLMDQNWCWNSFVLTSGIGLVPFGFQMNHDETVLCCCDIRLSYSSLSSLYFPGDATRRLCPPVDYVLSSQM